MIPGFLKAEAEKILGSRSGKVLNIISTAQVGGGCINHCFRLDTTSRKYFIKYNDAKRYPGMFEAEAKGLSLLRDGDAIHVPEVIAAAAADDTSFLLLEWIESGMQTRNFWPDFGKSLAKLHRNTDGHFGLEHDNYIGSLKQSNTQATSWTDFFVHQRIEPQLKMALDTGRMENQILKNAERFYGRMNELFPRESPALVHGDLWSGNFMTGKTGQVTLVDPAVYYGHREMDLSMTMLFGGFDPGFYSSYQEAFPLDPGFESRVDFYNLYPLLVHVNLFGGGYVRQVIEILNKF